MSYKEGSMNKACQSCGKRLKPRQRFYLNLVELLCLQCFYRKVFCIPGLSVILFDDLEDVNGPAYLTHLDSPQRVTLPPKPFKFRGNFTEDIDGPIHGSKPSKEGKEERKG